MHMIATGPTGIAMMKPAMTPFTKKIQNSISPRSSPQVNNRVRWRPSLCGHDVQSVTPRSSYAGALALTTPIAWRRSLPAILPRDRANKIW
jgi:hypothetical protein